LRRSSRREFCRNARSRRWCDGLLSDFCNHARMSHSQIRILTNPISMQIEKKTKKFFIARSQQVIEIPHSYYRLFQRKPIFSFVFPRYLRCERGHNLRMADLYALKFRARYRLRWKHIWVGGLLLIPRSP
jgi:hypothetical protein